MTTTRPLWRRIRHMLRLIANDGLSPHRAALIANVPPAAIDNPKAQHLMAKAQALVIREWLRTVTTADNSGQEHVDYVAEASPRATAEGRAPAAARTRAWKRTDWKARAWALERTFPREYGAVATPDVGSQVVEVIKAMAALRASVAGQPSQGLPRSLIAKPALPATVEDAHAGAYAREGDGETGETGGPPGRPCGEAAAGVTVPPVGDG